MLDQRDFVAGIFDGDGFVADASDDAQVGGDPQCNSFHGTHVATTAVAPQNNFGITGVAPAIGLIGIKVGYSVGELCASIVGDVPNAVLYAAGLPNASGSVPETAADVINLSLGGRREDPDLMNAIQQAVAAGSIVVAAAGNDGAPVRNFPAATDNVIAVGATDVLEEHAFYSSFYPEVDIAAPGGDTTVDQNGDGLPDGIVAGIASVNGSEFQAGLTGYNGTSMASPHVAAGIALMKGIAPSLTQSDIEAMLSAGNLTVDIGPSGFDNQTGFGLMSLPRMIQSAVEFTEGGTTDAVTVTTSTPASLDFGSSLSQISLELVRLGNDNIAVDSLTASDSLLSSDGTVSIGFAAPQSSDGFGVYSFALNRGAIDTGALSGNVTVNLSNDTTYVIPVTAVNQVVESVADSAAVFFIIERLNADGEFEALLEPFLSVDGVRGEVLTSPELEEGSYRFVFGTDTDNDATICDEGELCGTLPFSDFGFDSTFILSEDVSDTQYLLQDVATIALTGFDGTYYPAIEPRSVSKEQLLPTRLR